MEQASEPNTVTHAMQDHNIQKEGSNIAVSMAPSQASKVQLGESNKTTNEYGQASVILDEGKRTVATPVSQQIKILDKL